MMYFMLVTGNQIPAIAQFWRGHTLKSGLS